MSKVEIAQVEDADAKTLKVFLNTNHARLLGYYQAFCDKSAADLIEAFQNSQEKMMFSIRTLKSGDYKKNIRGFGFIEEIDWISRHAKVSLIKADEDNNLVGIGDCEETSRAFEALVCFCFDELNLNKVWTDVRGKSDAGGELERLGFVHEGVRRLAYNVGSKQVNSSVYSILREEFKCSG